MALDLSRIKGAFYGGIIGDAIGCTYEFRAASQIPKEQVIDIDVPPLNGKFTYDQPQGVWTDDTTMTLILMHALTRYHTDLRINARLWTNDFRENCLKWIKNGLFTSTDTCFDIGSQTYRAVMEWNKDVMIPPLNDGAQGNGALMRILPAAIQPSFTSALRISELTTMQTHHDYTAIACSRYLTAVLWNLLHGASFEHSNAAGAEVFYNYLGDSIEYSHHGTISSEDFRMIANTIGKPPLNGDAWCVATLANCLSIAGGSTSVMEGIEAAVRMGGDTDTNAAIVGTLLGARLGFTMELIERKDKVINIAFADNILSHYTAALKV